jgi:hydrogenase maturation protein HypF
MNARATTRRSARAHLQGAVQGVGFRPYVFRLAHRHGVAGSVRNQNDGVVIEVAGEAAAVAAFLAALPEEAPPLAQILDVKVENLPVTAVPDGAFVIAESRAVEAAGDVVLTPDAAACPDCRREVSDPNDRRYGYALNTCTNCGPRHTVIRELPYDRPMTTLADWPLCPACQAEYEDPLNRRYHAETTACPHCGPQVMLWTAAGEESRSAEAIAEARARLLGGEVLAVKSLGGYHLVTDARNETAVALLRERKRRPSKPLALMARDLDAVRSIAGLSADEEAALSAVERPILVLRCRPGAAIAPSIAPGLSSLGVMLPLTPLHDLLLTDGLEIIVATSANSSGETIIWSDERIRDYLAAGVVDAVLAHERPIVIGIDDSVMRLAQAHDGLPAAASPAPVILRRGRGFAPFPLDALDPAPFPILAYGADLKNAFAIAAGRRIQISPYIGDLDAPAARDFQALTLAHFEKLLGAVPRLAVCDLHPQFKSTEAALKRFGARVVRVQHHHAHFAACLAENGHGGRALGVVLDGYGYGEDGGSWGGEFLLGDAGVSRRLGHFAPAPAPGGDRAALECDRMAVACAQAAGALDRVLANAGLFSNRPPRQLESIGRLCAAISRGSPLGANTSAAGRLFDAAAALSGVALRNSYEGEAPMRLEEAAAACDGPEAPYPHEIQDGAGAPAVLSFAPAVARLIEDRLGGVSVERMARRFHEGVAAGVSELAGRLAREAGVETVALSGGVFANALLLAGVSRRLAALGLRVLIHRRLPPGDGCIAAGQAAAAVRRIRLGLLEDKRTKAS